MEKVCKNCEYFVQENISGTTYAWGHCKKPKTSVMVSVKNERGAFMWADKTCSDFKPKQKPDNNPGAAPKGGGKFLKQDCGQFG